MHNAKKLFNTDISGGLPAVLIKMLVASDPGVIRLFPARPAAWPSGTIEGVLCRGQVEIKRLTWDGKTIEAVLRIGQGAGDLLYAPGEIKTHRREKGRGFDPGHERRQGTPAVVTGRAGSMLDRALEFETSVTSGRSGSAGGFGRLKPWRRYLSSKAARAAAVVGFSAARSRRSRGVRVQIIKTASPHLRLDVDELPSSLTDRQIAVPGLKDESFMKRPSLGRSEESRKDAPTVFGGIVREGAPTRSAKVANRSLRLTRSPETVPALIFPGQRTMNGTRWPPSQISLLNPRKSIEDLCPLAPFWPPLSLVTMRSVLSAMPLALEMGVDFSDRPVEQGHKVAARTFPALAFHELGDKPGDVRGVGRETEEEGISRPFPEMAVDDLLRFPARTTSMSSSDQPSAIGPGRNPRQPPPFLLAHLRRHRNGPVVLQENVRRIVARASRVPEEIIESEAGRSAADRPAEIDPPLKRLVRFEGLVPLVELFRLCCRLSSSIPGRGAISRCTPCRNRGAEKRSEGRPRRLDQRKLVRLQYALLKPRPPGVPSGEKAVPGGRTQRRRRVGVGDFAPSAAILSIWGVGISDSGYSSRDLRAPCRRP